LRVMLQNVTIYPPYYGSCVLQVSQVGQLSEIHPNSNNMDQKVHQQI